MLIISAVAISGIIGGGLIGKVNETKVRYDLSVIQEEITTYALGQQMEQKSGIDLYPVFTDQTMANSGIDTNNLPDDLKQRLLFYANTAEPGKIPTITDIDYTQFYKIDKTKVQSAANYGDLYLYQNDTGFKVIDLDGITLGATLAYIVIPWNDMKEPQYVATSNNTYKLYGDGTLKVIGQLSTLSGATEQELDSFNGLQEFILPSESDSGIAQYTSSDRQINSEEDKVNLLYFNCGTVLVVDKDNTLWAWGDNSNNKLGLGNSYIVTQPTLIAHDVIKAWCGASNCWYLTKDNKLYVAGDNTSGVLGQGNTDSYINIVGFLEVSVPAGSVVNDILCITNAGCIIVCNGGDKVYYLGLSYIFLGTWDFQTTVKELTEFEGCKKIIYGGYVSFILKQDGTVWGCGANDTGSLGIGNTGGVTTLTKIPNINNVEDIALFNSGIIIKTNTGKLYLTGLPKKDATFDGVPFESTELYPDVLLSNNGLYTIGGKLYSCQIDNTVGSISLQQCYNTYTNVTGEFNYVFGMQMFKDNNKIYIESVPDITFPSKRIITSLKNIFSRVSFVQGRADQINIVNIDGEMYEDLTNKNTEIPDVAQLISIGGARYALTKDGRIFAKSYYYPAGGWGDINPRYYYTQISTTDGITSFGKVKKIFEGVAGIPECIFITDDNKIYWMGNDSGICFVGAKSNVVFPDQWNKTFTLYPEYMNDKGDVLSGIADKIKDIQFSEEVFGVVGLQSTLILTDDGELYTMSSDARTTGLGADKGVPTDFKLLNDGTENLGNKKISEAKIGGGISWVITDTGEVYAWGYNYYGLMGPEYTLGAWYDTPQKLSISNIKSLEIGDGFAIFIGKSGEIWGIGNNAYGQLGDGTTTSTNTFVRCTELEK